MREIDMEPAWPRGAQGGGVGDQEEHDLGGDLGWCRRAGSPARRTLYTFQLSLNHSKTARVSQVEEKQKQTNQVTSFSFATGGFTEPESQ